ncbi:hypothetical protein MASR2M18_20840 [Ignavibacteria bacterium]|jgi:flagella basal body P-ring formation protein FlgA|nr:flagellar basal body P-ring formation protein FlgA [Bacteroidota bacterium]MCZ2131978.1 flagellar basal body P-ring formation chaperone FlgA [Bacteroidota bacterium]
MTARKHLIIGGRTQKNNGGATEVLLRFLIAALIVILTATLVVKSQSVFSGSQLRSAAVDYAYGIAGNDAEIAVISAVSEEKFTESGVTARCTGESFRGKCSVAIEFLLNDKIIRRTSVAIYAKIYRSVAVASESLAPGVSLSEGKYEIRKQDVSAYSDGDIPSPDELNGAALRRPVGKGFIITRSTLLAAGGVRRGETIAIRVIAGTITLTTSGTALNDASPGEMIRVTRNGSANVFAGLLADDSTVEITVKK